MYEVLWDYRLSRPEFCFRCILCVRSEQELMLWLKGQFYMETYQNLQKMKYTRVEFVNISDVFIFDWISYEFKIEMKLPVIYNNVF